MPTMTMTNDQLAAVAKMLVEAAKQKSINLRVVGGVAIELTCANLAAQPKLQRARHDLDLVAPRGDWHALAGIFAAHGWEARAHSAHPTFEKDGVTLELFAPNFGFANFAPRLGLATPTLPLADLLLIKLQRVPFADKDRQDAIALLIEHRVAAGAADDHIDAAYLGKLCAHNWGLFHRVYDNTIALEQVLDQYLEPEEAQLVWRRIETIQSELDRQPKGLRWMCAQFLRKPTQVPR